MKKTIILLLLITVSCASPRSCPELVHNKIEGITTNINGELYTGRCLTYENEVKRSVQQYLNGKDYGKWIFYFPDGKVQTKGKFSKYGKRTGIWRYYYENGELSQISRYSRNGERIGKWINYNSEGEKVSETNY